MSVFRIQKDKENPYVMLNKVFLNDTNLSLKAKGLLAYFLSLPDDWQIYEEEVVKHHKDGRDSVKSAIKELIQNGYIDRTRMRDDKGRLGAYEYRVYEVSIQNGNSNVGESNAGESNVGESGPNNNNLNNNDLTNNNSTNRKEGSEDGREGTKPKGVSTMSISSIPFYDYIGKLINSYADMSKAYKQDIYESIVYYCSRYEEEFGVEHIRYKTTTLKIVIKRLYDLYTVGIWDEQRDVMVGDDLSLDDFKTIVDKNFTVEFNGKGGKRMSYTLLSFLNDNVLVHRFYEELL